MDASTIEVYARSSLPGLHPSKREPDNHVWRDGYRRYLIDKSIAPDQAADMAAKVAFRADLYPLDLDHLPSSRANSQDRPPLRRTSGNAKLLESGQIIATTPPTGDDMAFTHTVFCQVGLPRRKIEGREFHRQSGDRWINIQAGYLDEGRGAVAQPVPYGAMPRLALALISTLAIRHNTREISIGDSASQFLKMMGMDDQKNRYTKLREQMHALAACRLQIGYPRRTFNGEPIQQFDAWIADADTGQKALWPGVLVLSENYYKELIEHGVPLDKRALLALKGSALALDVYTWLAHRLHRISGRPYILHWKPLREQFAQEFQGKNPHHDFKKNFRVALSQALAVYPEAKVKVVTGGLLLMASPPPIPYSKR